MAGLTITVGGNDITAYVDVRSIVIEEVGTELVATCRFFVRDHSGTVAIGTKDAVDIDDDGTTIFAGEVANVSDNQEGIATTWSVTCHDYNILLDETVIEAASYTASESDAYILNDLFTTYRSDIDASTYVSTLDATMEDVAWTGMTLREILDDLASRTGARYYVDYDKNLHWFDTEADTAAFSLSTSPDMATSYPFGGFRRVRRASKIAEKVYVLGKEVSGWYPAGAPSYDGSARHAVSRDQRITTSQGVEDRGKAIYDRFNAAQYTYELWTEKEGLHAGESVTLVNATWGINDSFYIRKMQVEVLGTDGEKRRYHLWLNDEGPEPSRSARHRELVIARLETEVNSVGDTVFDTDAPAAPTALDASNVTTAVSEDADGTQIVYAEITWSEVADSDLDHYLVQVSTQSDFSSDIVTRTHPAGGDRRERFSGLVGNTAYYVRVRAVDWVGNDSAWDYGGGSAYSFTSAKDSSAPAQVAGLSASSSRTIVGLSWTANSEGDLRYYEIQRADDAAGAPDTWATIAYAQLSYFIDDDFTDAQIAAEDTFWYRVRAVDTSGNNGTWAAQTSVALGQITTDHIAANTITAANIAAGTITATEMNVSQLSAIAADLGTITAGTVTGATIRTAASGARVVQDSTDGVQVYNASDTLTAQLDVDGSGQLGSSDYEPIVWNAAGEINKLKANQINLGDPGIFSESDGLLLLGPGCEITSTSWTSLRGQTATISGAFHQVAGAWPGTRALMVENATTNYCKAPRMIDDDSDDRADGWLYASSVNGSPTESVIEQDIERRGWLQSWVYTGIAGDSSENLIYYLNTDSGSFAAGDNCSVSFDARGNIAGATLKLWIVAKDSGGSTLGTTQQTTITLTKQLQRFEVTRSSLPATTDYVQINLRLDDIDDGDYVKLRFGAVSIENSTAATSFCAGSLPWCSWSGTEDASVSTRAATDVVLDSLTDLISNNNSVTYAAVVQAPYAATDSWTANGGDHRLIFDAEGSSVRVHPYFDAVDQKIKLHLNGTAEYLASSALSFEQYERLEVTVVLDYANNNGYLYINGELVDSDTSTAISSGVFDTGWELGTTADDDYQSGWRFSEYAVFDSVLTAEQVAVLYQRNAPLADAGAYDTPGVYILDGRFRVATSTSGARTQIDASGWRAWNVDGNAAFALAMENSLSWDGGTLDTNDVQIGRQAAHYILWDDSEGTVAVKGSITITGGSGIGSLSDAGALAEEDDLDGVPDGTSYGRLLLSDISGGHIQLTSNVVIDGEWYDESGVEIDASSGINIYGTDSAFTTRATKTGPVQCKVDSNGAIVAGAGAITLDATRQTIKSSGDSGNYLRWTNSDITTYADLHAAANLQETDPDGNSYGVFNVGIEHDSDNRAVMSFWLNEADVLIQKSGSYRYVTEFNYDYVRINSVPVRLGTGSSDPTTSIEDGMLFYRTDTDKMRLRADGSWLNLATEDWHSNLSGGHVTNGDSHDHVGGDGGQIDHGGLGGLADDDHTQYLLASGTREMSGNLDLGANDLIDVDKVRLNDVGSSHPGNPASGVYFYHLATASVNAAYLKWGDGTIHAITDVNNDRSARRVALADYIELDILTSVPDTPASGKMRWFALDERDVSGTTFYDCLCMLDSDGDVHVITYRTT